MKVDMSYAYDIKKIEIWTLEDQRDDDWSQGRIDLFETMVIDQLDRGKEVLFIVDGKEF